LPPFVDGDPRSVSPSKGEHTEAILREHGYRAEDITQLVEAGIVGR
jgi:crotonobetainyl-CoA:carnitine CoA-transferase CaiB-like acyl-CoA transferase